MKTILVAMGIVAAGSLSAFAAEPVKMMDAKMGKVMTTPKGMTLYTFDKDTKDKSNCDAKCLKNWPAFHADAEATAEDEWTLVKDADGKDMLAMKASRSMPRETRTLQQILQTSYGWSSHEEGCR